MGKKVIKTIGTAKCNAAEREDNYNNCDKTENA